MHILIPNDKIFIERPGEEYQCWKFTLQGEFVLLKEKPNLKDLVFKENENFYTHWQDEVKYWTVGDELIRVQEYKAVFPNHGFHGIHDRYLSRT